MSQIQARAGTGRAWDLGPVKSRLGPVPGRVGLGRSGSAPWPGAPNWGGNGARQKQNLGRIWARLRVRLGRLVGKDSGRVRLFRIFQW